MALTSLLYQTTSKTLSLATGAVMSQGKLAEPFTTAWTVTAGPCAKAVSKNKKAAAARSRSSNPRERCPAIPARRGVEDRVEETGQTNHFTPRGTALTLTLWECRHCSLLTPFDPEHSPH
uniref:Uncharacterized protein n=1 Tax=Graphocephala atropunctata TaxID=36148 RepID=A0A1B6L4Z6_9HEMI